MFMHPWIRIPRLARPRARAIGPLLLALALQGAMPGAARAEDLLGMQPSSTFNPNFGWTPNPSIPSTLNGNPGPSSSQLLDGWGWQAMPEGVIYPAYLAGVKEPRLAAVFDNDRNLGWIVDAALGGRVGVIRYGTEGPQRPSGIELELEGAAFPRLDLEHARDLVAVDFRAGVPLVLGLDRYQTKLGYYHLSSHLADEYMIRVPDYERINYVRESLVWGNSYYLHDDLRLYAEVEWSFYVDGGAEPWGFQFGIDFSPTENRASFFGAPFAAVNYQIRQEVDFEGDFVAQLGWQWRSLGNHLLRLGAQYFTGPSDQMQFFRRYEEKIGLAIWYDY
jgi:hypothetical protein